MAEDEIVVTDEMRAAVRREECRLGGHSYDVVEILDGVPVRLVCMRCGTAWDVEGPP